MKPDRLNALTDGVVAIVLTIMVLELRFPEQATLAAVLKVLPLLAAYLLAFIYVAIYWNNHHHMMHATERVSGSILWANLHLLFWLSLLPFTTGWMGENHFARWPTALYGVNLLCCAIAYFILQQRILATERPDGRLARAIGIDLKGKTSPLLYLLGIASAWLVAPWLGLAFFVAAPLLWLIPDRRIERIMEG